MPLFWNSFCSTLRSWPIVFPIAFTKWCAICFVRKIQSIQNAQTLPSQNKIHLHRWTSTGFYPWRNTNKLIHFHLPWWRESSPLSDESRWREDGLDRWSWGSAAAVIRCREPKLLCSTATLHTAAPHTRPQGSRPGSISSQYRSIPARGSVCVDSSLQAK